MKSSKGISLVALTVTVMILLIISSMLVYNAKSEVKIRNLMKMNNDLSELKDKIDMYYAKNGDIPLLMQYPNHIKFEQQPNDMGEYYIIDIRAINILSLNYGSGFEKYLNLSGAEGSEDVYIIDKQSHHIYYARGINVDGNIFYTNTSDDKVKLFFD